MLSADLQAKNEYKILIAGTTIFIRMTCNTECINTGSGRDIGSAG